MFKNFIYKLILEFFRICIPIILIPYIYRIFKPEIMGQIEFSQSLSGYFIIFAGFGVYKLGLRELSRNKNNSKKNKIFSELFLISTISTIVVTIIYLFYIYFKFNNNILLKNMLLINSINIISYIFFIEWVNEAFEDYKFISQKTIFIKIINLFFVFLFIKISSDFYKYLLLINIFIFINNIISFKYIKKYVKLELKDLNLRKYFYSLFIIVLISNMNIMYTQLDKITLGFYSKDISEVAYYGVAQKIMLIVITVVVSISTISIPRLSKYLGENKKNKYEELLNNLISYSCLLLFPMAIGIIILSREICYFFAGDLYLSAKITVRIFGIRVIIMIFETILSNQVIFLHQKEKTIAFIYGICGFINVIFKYFLIKFNYFTAATAGFTTMLAEVLIVAFSYLYIKKYLNIKIKIFTWENFRYILFSLVFFIIKFVFKSKNMNYILYSLMIFFICSTVYFLLLLLTKDKCLEENLKKINIKLKKRG